MAEEIIKNRWNFRVFLGFECLFRNYSSRPDSDWRSYYEILREMLLEHGPGLDLACFQVIYLPHTALVFV